MKVEEGESIIEAAVRELEEEAGIIAVKPIKQGVIKYHMLNTNKKLELHIFTAKIYKGEIMERFVDFNVSYFNILL